MRRIVLVAALFLLAAVAPADARVVAVDHPASLVACASTVSSIAAAETAVNGASGGQTICLTDGTYGAVTLDNVAATSRVTLKAVNPLGTVFTDTVTLGSMVGIDGLDISAAGSRGDCVLLPVGGRGAAILNSRLHDCGRDGIRWEQPLLDGSNEVSNTLVLNNLIDTVGVANDAANSVTLRGDTATFLDNELTRSPNDAVDLWGDGHVFRGNHIHDYSNTVGNHVDAFQTWGGPDDGYRGTDLTNLLLDRNTIENLTGRDSHGLMIEGSNSDLTIQDNLWSNIGSSAADLQDSQSNVWFLRNTFVDTGAISFASSGGSSTGGRIIGNIFAGTTPPYVTASCSCTEAYNLAQRWRPSRDAHALHADPMFESSTDFHLRSGSPAVNSGDPASTGRWALDGQAQVGIVDRGAFERP
jgi:hypothetical protein